MAAEKSLKDLYGAVFKIAENSPKIQRDVKDIRDAVCGKTGIMEILMSIDESLTKLGKDGGDGRAFGRKGDNSASLKKIYKSTDSIVKSLKKIITKIDKVGKGSGKALGDIDFSGIKADKNDRLLKSIEVIERMRGIKPKDFILAKEKIKHLGKVMADSLKIFKKFKNNKEAEQTISFISSSIEVMEKLAKVSIISKPAQWGAKAIEKIFLGDGKKSKGLLKLFREIDKNKKELKDGKKGTKMMAASCGSMLITSLLLVGIAVLSPVALLGALAMKGLVLLMIGTFKLLSGKKVMTAIIKGAIVMAVMGAAVITYALGLNLMTKATRGMKLADVGIMVASIGATALAVAGIGLLAIPIAIGSGILLLMGASLGIFALALSAWAKFDSSKAMNSIRNAVGGLSEVFGLDLGNKAEDQKPGKKILGLGGKVLDIALAVLDFGKTFFVMGSLLMAGAALGILYVGIKKWDNYNGKKAAANIEVAIGALKKAFGLDVKEGESPKEKVKGHLGDLIGLASSVLQMGKTFVMMGTLVLATAMMDAIRITLIPWQNYNGEKAVKNMKIAINALNDCFGLKTREGEAPKEKVRGGLGDLIALGSSVLKMGSTFVMMGTLVFATAMMDIIRLTLLPWEDYDATKAVGNMRTALDALKDCMGLNNGGNDIKGSLKESHFDLFSLGSSLLQMGKTFNTMATLLIVTGSMEKIKESLVAWEDYDATKSISNIKNAIVGLQNLFGLSSVMAEESGEEDKGAFAGLKRLGSKLVDAVKAPFEAIGDVLQMGSALAEGGLAMTRISSMLTITATLLRMKNALEPWERFNCNLALKKVQFTINGVLSLVKSSGESYADSMKFISVSDNFSNGIMKINKALKKSPLAISTLKLFKEQTIPNAITQTVNAIEKIDISKAIVLKDVLDSFSKINGVRKIDKFTKAVDRFVDACNEMVESIDRLSNMEFTNPLDNIADGDNGESVNAGAVVIRNTEQLADEISKALRSLNVRLDSSLLDINLVAEGCAGKTVKLTVQD